MAPDRYEDADVRANEETFRALAYAYLDQYHGNFHVLTDFKRIHLRDETLNVRQVRTILNCMLIDPRVSNMPIPSDHHFDAGSYKVRRYNLGHGDQPILTEVRPKYRADKVKMKSHVNYDYGISNAKQAHVIHRVDHQVTPAIWYPCSGKMLYSTQWICTTDERTFKNSILLTEPAALNLLGKPAFRMRHWNACRLCDQWKEERDVRQAEIDAKFEATRL
jgi:hypothetical protein